MKLFILALIVFLQILGCALMIDANRPIEHEDNYFYSRLKWYGGLVIIFIGLGILAVNTPDLRYLSANMPVSQKICDDYANPATRPPLKIQTEPNWKKATEHCDFTQAQFCNAYECNKKINPTVNFFENDCTEYTLKNKMVKAVLNDYQNGVTAQRFAMNPHPSLLPPVKK